MEAKELREMSVEDLKAKLEELRKEYFNRRFQSALDKTKSMAGLITLKKDIARVLTVLREKGVKL